MPEDAANHGQQGNDPSRADLNVSAESAREIQAGRQTEITRFQVGQCDRCWFRVITCAAPAPSANSCWAASGLMMSGLTATMAWVKRVPPSCDDEATFWPARPGKVLSREERDNQHLAVRSLNDRGRARDVDRDLAQPGRQAGDQEQGCEDPRTQRPVERPGAATPAFGGPADTVAAPPREKSSEQNPHRFTAAIVRFALRSRKADWPFQRQHRGDLCWNREAQ